MEDTIEENNACRENILTRETDGGAEGQDPDDGSGTRSSEPRSQEDEGAGSERGGGEDQSEPDEFDLKPQTREELEVRAAEQEAPRAAKEAEQRKAEAAEKKAREDK